MTDASHPSSSSTVDPLTIAVLERVQRVRDEQRTASNKQVVFHDGLLQWVLLAMGFLLIGGVLLWPMGTLADRLQLIVRGVCDQQHTLLVGNTVLPLDARCTGIYLGFPVTLLYLFGRGRARVAKLPPLKIMVLCVGMMVLMTIDGFNSVLQGSGAHFYLPHNAMRVATGLGMGVAMAVLGLPLFTSTLYVRSGEDQQVICSWREGFEIASIIALVGLLLQLALPWLYYPLALVSVGSMVGVLLLVNLAVVALLGELRRRIVQLSQLTRPATLSLCITVIELAYLAWLRGGG